MRVGDGADRPRIGIAGSAGVGKTTLALTLAGALDLPVLPEEMRARLEGGFSLHAISRLEHQELLLSDMAALDARLRASEDGCVADRTPLDLAAFWFCNGFPVDREADTSRLMHECVRATERFDIVVVLPWGRVPLMDDGIRSTNPWHQLHTQTVIEGLCRRYVDAARLAFMPPEIDEPDTRCRWVMRRLGMSV